MNNFFYHPLLLEIRKNENESDKDFKNRVNAAELKVWKEEIDSQFNSELIEAWKDIIGYYDYGEQEFCFDESEFEEIKEWIAIGFQPEEYNLVDAWKKENDYFAGKIFSVQDVKKWINVGLKKDDSKFAHWLKEFKLLTPEKYLKNIEKENYYKLKKEKEFQEKLGLKTSYNDQRKLLDSGFSFEEIKKWNELGIVGMNSLEEAKFLKENIGYEKTKEWKDWGIDLNLGKSLIYYWNKKGVSPKDCKDCDVYDLIEKEININDWLDVFYPKNSVCLLIDDYTNYGKNVKKIYHLNLGSWDLYANLVGNIELDRFENLNNLKCNENQLIALIENGIEKLPKSLDKMIIGENFDEFRGIMDDYLGMYDYYGGYEGSYSGTEITFEFKEWIKDKNESKLSKLKELEIINKLLKSQVKLQKSKELSKFLVEKKQEVESKKIEENLVASIEQRLDN